MEASGNVMTGMKDDGGEAEEEEGLHPQDIDAYWLQRRVAKAYEETGNPIDADKSQELANDVFSILQACTVWLLTLEPLIFGDTQVKQQKSRGPLVWCHS